MVTSLSFASSLVVPSLCVSSLVTFLSCISSLVTSSLCASFLVTFLSFISSLFVSSLCVSFFFFLESAKSFSFFNSDFLSKILFCSSSEVFTTCSLGLKTENFGFLNLIGVSLSPLKSSSLSFDDRSGDSKLICVRDPFRFFSSSMSLFFLVSNSRLSSSSSFFALWTSFSFLFFFFSFDFSFFFFSSLESTSLLLIFLMSSLSFKLFVKKFCALSLSVSFGAAF